MRPTVCACMGAMYGEPYCYCTMEKLGLPLNIEARKIEDDQSKKQLAALFGPGGLWYRPRLPIIPPNARILKSRNQREGCYAGYSRSHYRIAPSSGWPKIDHPSVIFAYAMRVNKYIRNERIKHGLPKDFPKS